MEASTPVGVEQAAAFLGVSASTVRKRRRAKDHEPVFEVSRPQGLIWRVHLPPDVMEDADPRP